MPKLIKDFQNYQIVFYWYQQGEGRLSPLLPTLTHAQEWLVQWHSHHYSGTERRKRGANMELKRRKTDKAIYVDVDLSKKKLNALKHQFAA